MVVTGLGVRFRMASSTGRPQSGSFVSTTTTPVVPTKTAVLPPPPFSMNRLSRSFSTSTTFGAAACDAVTTSDSAPAISNVARTMTLFIKPPVWCPVRAL